MDLSDDVEGGTNTMGRKPAPTIMACGLCDVTWRGWLGDNCWACGHSAHTVVAPPPQVKIPAPA